MEGQGRWQSRLATGLNLLGRETLHVASSSDEVFIPHFAALMHSLADRQRSSVHVHLLAGANVSTQSEEMLSDFAERLGCRITVHRPDLSQLSRLPVKFSQATWYRHLLPELLPDLDRVLYIDADALVTDSIDWLWRLDLSGHCVAAVTNLPMTLEWMERRCARLGLPSVDDYFNTGVMLMNLRELRSGDWIERIFEYAEAHADHQRRDEVDESSPREIFAYTMRHPERLLFPDQDAANAVLWRRRLKLHPRWNYQLLFRRFDVRTPELTEDVIAEAAKRPAIRHFEGPGHSKPWHPDAEPEDRELYWAHRSQTPWAAPG